MQIAGAKSVHHLYPRAYCIAKPAPLCAVFVRPWMDAAPQVRTPEYSSSCVVHEGVEDVRVGDWCALAYVVTDRVQQIRAFPLPNVASDLSPANGERPNQSQLGKAGD